VKVIGTAGTGYILSATSDEVANLIGHCFMNSECPRLNIGDSIRIASMYQQLRDLHYKKAELESVQKTLRVTADLLSTINPVFPAVAAEPDKKEEKQS